MSLGGMAIAIGALVDYDMLTKAKKGYLVVDHRQNEGVINHLANHTTISQISFTDFTHKHLHRATLSEVLEEFFLY